MGFPLCEVGPAYRPPTFGLENNKCKWTWFRNSNSYSFTFIILSPGHEQLRACSQPSMFPLPIRGKWPPKVPTGTVLHEAWKSLSTKSRQISFGSKTLANPWDRSIHTWTMFYFCSTSVWTCSTATSFRFLAPICMFPQSINHYILISKVLPALKSISKQWSQFLSLFYISNFALQGLQDLPWTNSLLIKSLFRLYYFLLAYLNSIISTLTSINMSLNL